MEEKLNDLHKMFTVFNKAVNVKIKIKNCETKTGVPLSDSKGPHPKQTTQAKTHEHSKGKPKTITN